MVGAWKKSQTNKQVPPLFNVPNLKTIRPKLSLSFLSVSKMKMNGRDREEGKGIVGGEFITRGRREIEGEGIERAEKRKGNKVE